MWQWVLTRLIVVIILQYIQISNYYVAHLRLLYVNYTSILKNRLNKYVHILLKNYINLMEGEYHCFLNFISLVKSELEPFSTTCETY